MMPGEYPIRDTKIFLDNADRGAVTVVFANNVYFEQRLIQNLLCSWRRISFHAYVVVAVDSVANTNVRTIEDKVHWGPEWWKGVGTGLLRPTNVKTPEYVSFIHRRTRFIEFLLLNTVLDIILCDADTVWTRNLLLDGTLPMQSPYDQETQRCDAFVVNSAHRGGKGSDMVEPLGGFIGVKNNNNTRMWYRAWTAMEACLQSKEQPAMHASLRVLDARFVRPFFFEEDMTRTKKPITPTQPVLCVLHDAYFPTGFHMSNGYLNDYPHTKAIALGHASIPEKTGKQEWLTKYGWWYLTEEGTCDMLKTTEVTSKGDILMTRKMFTGVKNLEVVHWMKKSETGRQCTEYVTEKLPELARQVAQAVAERRLAKPARSDYPRLFVHHAPLFMLLLLFLYLFRLCFRRRFTPRRD